MEAIEFKENWSICGHEKNVQFLRSGVKNKNLAHGLLFTGLSNLGKLTVAKKLAAAVLCSKKKEGEPCLECFDCRQVEHLSHPDLFLIEKEIDEKTGKQKRSISVNQVRDLRTRLQQGSLLGGYKVAIIPEAQHLNLNGANSLLKILEEPGVKTLIILIAPDESMLPKTVVSRCQTIRFLPVASKKMEKYLSVKMKLAEEEAKIISRQALLRPGLAISLARDRQYRSEINEQTAWFFSLISSDLGRRFEIAEDKFVLGTDDNINWQKISDILSVWKAVLRDLLLFKTGNEARLANLDFTEALSSNAAEVSLNQLRHWSKSIQETERMQSMSIGAKNAFDNLIIKI